MKVINIHQRTIPLPVARVNPLIDSLASSNDLLWPHESWPRMKFDRLLKVGAIGGHGPIRYNIVAYTPGSIIRFQFTAPKGFDGYHEFKVTLSDSGCVIRHTLEMTTRGFASLSWPLVYRPLHDALIEDALAKAQESLGLRAEIKSWSMRVKFLHSFFRVAAPHRKRLATDRVFFYWPCVLWSTSRDVEVSRTSERLSQHAARLSTAPK